MWGEVVWGVGFFFPFGVTPCTWKKVKFGILCCSRPAADPFLKGWPPVPRPLPSLPPLAAGWASGLKDSQPLLLFCSLALLQLPGSCKLHCQVPFFLVYLPKACHVPGETLGTGKQWRPNTAPAPRTSECSKKGRSERINRPGKGGEMVGGEEGAHGAGLLTRSMGQGSGSPLAYFPHL